MSVPHALLALLASAPRHGLHLKRQFEARTGSIWPLNVGQVYTTLGRLERDDLVRADAEGSDTRQRLYELTSAGRAELERWLNETPGDARPPRDELVIKVLVALAVPGVDTAAVIDRHRQQLVESMQAYTRLKVHDDSLEVALVADAELFRLEGAVRWLDMAQARLARGERPSVRAADEIGEDSSPHEAGEASLPS